MTAAPLTAYVAGPMTNRPHFNFPAFDSVSRALRLIGVEVSNPHEHDQATYPGIDDAAATVVGDVAAIAKEVGFSFVDVMRWDLTEVIRTDAIVLLPGWETSTGAKAERFVAEMTGSFIILARTSTVTWSGWTFDDDDIQKRLSVFAMSSGRDPVPVPPVIVGISGYARSGKDTMGRILVEDHGFEVVKFAGLLYDILYAMNPQIYQSLTADYRPLQELVNHFGWEMAKINYPDVRAYLQRLGTEGVRNHLGEDTWVDAAMRLCKPYGKYVFTDVRFPNEADAILDAGGSIWRMQRAGNVPESGHASEQLVDSLPYDQLVSSFEQPDAALLRRSLAEVAEEILV